MANPLEEILRLARSNTARSGAASAAEVARDLFARVVPTRKSVIRSNIARDAEQILSNTEGFTYNPRTGKFIDSALSLPEDDVTKAAFGEMMVPRVETAANRMPAGATQEDLINLIENPEVMNQLRRGEYLGGYLRNDISRPGQTGPEFVVEPARRYLNSARADMAGALSGQDAGFAMRAGEFPKPDVTNAQDYALRQMLYAVPTAASGATAIATDNMDGQEPGLQSALGALAVLAGGAMGIRGAKNLKALAPLIESLPKSMLSKAGRSKGFAERMSSAKGYISPAGREQLKAAGVPVGPAGEAPAPALKSMVRGLVPDAELDAIPDDISEADAAVRIYNLVHPLAEERFGVMPIAVKKRLVTDLKSERNTIVPTAQEVKAYTSNVTRQRKASKVANEANLPRIDKAAADVGARPVRNVKAGIGKTTTSKETGTSTVNTVEKFDPSKSAASLAGAQRDEAFEDIVHNFGSYITKADIAEAKARSNQDPLFYVVSHLRDRILAAYGKEPMILSSARSGIASSQADPWTETKKKMASYVLRSASKQPVGAVNVGKRIADINNTVDSIVGDIVQFVTSPYKTKGMRAKIANYFGTIVRPSQRKTSVIDSWMQRAAFGIDGLPAPTSIEGHNFLMDAVNLLANKYELPPSVIQEIIWKNVRVANGARQTKSFGEMFNEALRYPTKPAGAQIIGKVPTDAFKSMLAKENKDISDRFVSGLTEAINKNPELAKYFEISGEDVVFSDKWYDLLS